MRVLFALLIIGVMCGPVSGQVRPEPFVHQISDLNRLNPSYGTHEVVGYVVKIYECPPCPKEAQCKPCMPDHIVIAERRSRFAEYVLTDREMIVFVDDVQGLRLNKKYRFLVRILNVKTMDQIINNPKLIYFERIR